MNRERVTQMVLSPFLLSPHLLRCLKVCLVSAGRQVGVAPWQHLHWSVCPMWHMIAAVVGENRRVGCERPMKLGKVLRGTVLVTDLGNAGPGCYGHGAAPRHQGDTTPWRGTAPFQGYLELLWSWVSRIGFVQSHCKSFLCSLTHCSAV